MEFDTEAIRRLRDRLLEIEVAPEAAPPGAAAAPSLDGLGPVQQAALERVGPLAEALFLAMTADGVQEGSERRAVRAAIAVLTDGLLPDTAVDPLLERLERSLETQGREARLEAVATRFALDPTDAETAFTLAAAIALSDGRVDAAEQALIEQMRSYFGIGAARARALLEGAPTTR